MRTLLLAPTLLAACLVSPQPRALKYGELIEPGAVWSRALVDVAAPLDTVVLVVGAQSTDEAVLAAAQQVRSQGLQLGYWFEIGRDEALANAHPEWVASLQGHEEWQQQHGAHALAVGEVVQAWPWVPIAYAEVFAVQRDRLAARLAALPPADFVFLNDLQGPPSACGCGNVLCRWATDYTLGGRVPLRSATPLGNDAAARFVCEVAAMVPQSLVIPVWVTECEEADTVKDGACHGVGCYGGACWREFDAQWAPLRAAAPQVALLLAYRAFGRDLPRFGGTAGWVEFAIEHLRAREKKQHARELLGESRLAVVEGWSVDADVGAQCAHARAAGVTSVLVSRTPIDQSLVPRVRRGRR